MRLLIRTALAFIVLAITWFVFSPLSFGNWHRPLADTPADHGIAFETVEFTPRDQPLTLRAWWMPAAQPKAALIMVHGGSSNRSFLYTDWLTLAAALIGRGYAVLSLDLRNHGESGDTRDVTPTFGVDEANDVIAAIDYLRSRDGGLRFAAAGHSMGGQTVLYAGVRDRRLEAVVSDSTYTDARSITAPFAHASTGLPTALFSAPFLWSAEYLHGIPLGRARAVDVVGALAPRPVLLIHDAADPIVPVEQVRQLAAAYSGADVWITSTPPGDLPDDARTPFGTHCRSYSLHPDEYTARVVAFLDRTFAAAPAASARGARE